VYNQDLVSQRNVSADQYNYQVELLKSQGKDEMSARGMLRGASKHFYQGLLQPAKVKSGVDGVLVARGRLSPEDACLCGVKREHEASIDQQELRRLRKTVKNVGAEGTRILHSRMYDMRFQQTQLMMNDDTMKPDEAAKIVRQQCIDNKTYLFRDKDNNPLPAKEHCKLYFDQTHDKESKRVEMRIAAESAALALDGPPGSSLDEEMMPGPSSCIGSSSQLRAGAAASASSASIASPPKEKMYRKLVVDKGFWGKLPTFVQIAKVPLVVSLLILHV
jgi:hypothetical protein